ncbi:MAG TPA: PKD domain-containing protein [Cyclobacteriaceae bacterium]|nr:PKD domain-containing protein [Cyclobacteriaceae bacterium]
MKYGICFVINVIMVFASMAQPPVANFMLQANGCIGEDILVTNQSLQAIRYEWDVCQGDLALTPAGAVAGAISGASIPTGVDIVFDGTTWHAFVASRDTHSIFRATMGTDLNSFASLQNLGNPGSVLSQPIDIKVVSDNGNWYAFVFNEGADIISRLDFGNSLLNTPTAVVVLHTNTGRFVQNQGLDVIRNGSTWYVVYTMNTGIGVLRLTDIEDIPGPSDQLLSSNIAGNPPVGDITILKDQGNFYGYTISNTSPALYRLAFGTNIFSDPVQTNLSSVLPAASLNYYGIAGANDGGRYYLLSATIQGSMVRTDLGPDLSQNPASSGVIGNAGVFGNTVKNVLVKNKTDWFNFAVDYTNGNLFKAAFPSPTCQLSPGLFTSEQLSLEFPDQGIRYVSLRSFNGGAFDEVHRSVNISALMAPDLSWTNLQVCAQLPVSFNYSSNLPVASQNWDFGDGQSSNAASIQHTYNSGSYTTSLVVHAQNGCTNTIIKDLTFYDPPSASFMLPAGLICSNTGLMFTNQTTDDFDGHLAYQWTVDDAPIAVTRDLSYAFPSPGDHEVTLEVSIPGCNDEQTKTITGVLTGPTASFATSGICEGLPTTLTNQSSGDITGYNWDFGNGQTGTSPDATQVYDAGTWNVTLNVSSSNGCVGATKKDIIIFSVPDANLSLDLPPFSCAGTPSQFHDDTPPPTDSNIDQWTWTFGDGGTGTGKDPLHTYVAAGAFNVRLAVTTDKGCTASKNLEVSIAQSPVAAFTSDPTCLNQSTRFTSTSTGDIKSYQWKIGNQVYALVNPVHVFAATGNSSAQLTVTGNNDCVSTMTKPVVVPIVPTLDFEVKNACSGQAVTFRDLTSGSADPIFQETWTFNGSETRNGSQVNFSFPNGGAYPVKLDVKNQSGCVYSLTRQVTINPSPVAGFTMSIDSGPPPLQVSFTNTSTGTASYQWNFNDGSGFRTEPLQEYTYNALGDYPVTLNAISAQGCVSIQSQFVHVIIPFNELALEEFSVVQSGSGYRGYVRVHNNGNYRIGGFSLTYDVGGGILFRENLVATLNPGQTSMILLSNEFTNPAADGYICAELQSDNNLVDNKACAVFNESVVLTPYPNPTDIYLNIETVQPEAGTVRVMLFNSSGGDAYDKTFDVSSGLSRLSLDVQNLSPGIYIAVITAGATTTSRRVLIHR